MNRTVVSVGNRLSLRPPQRRSLEILADLSELLPLCKQQDVADGLKSVSTAYPQVSDFEREFPSLCFALATGVGKTRLMGAMIAFLHAERGFRHFMVLAPNLTIYEKLIRDFTPGTAKYVFQGIGEFAVEPPEVITGETYDSGKTLFRNFEKGVHINIFNIAKITGEMRGGKSPRIKRLSEYIGQSYFEYLSSLDDLVLFMDEAHRYRASAGQKAIDELKPILGIELTATPKRGNQEFKNVIYSYPLSAAMTDGFVKEPTVVTRENFNAKQVDEGTLEKIKLEDGVAVHEDVKLQLEIYARDNDKPIVKPFMLVVAQTTDHADRVLQLLESDGFFDGRYKGKAITVHSKQSGELEDATLERLLRIEHGDEPTEIVVHVNKLGEGWDVTNLFTIVPLRASTSEILTEQTIGRGLRLPYGRRTGVKAVDTLKIIAHDRFQEIIDKANEPDSIIKSGAVIGRDIPAVRQETVEVVPDFVAAVKSSSPETKPLFESPDERAVAQITLDVVKQLQYLPRSADLQKPEVQAQIVKEVSARYTVAQPSLEGTAAMLDVKETVQRVTEAITEKIIDIPRIVVVPKGEVTCWFEDFDLDTSNVNQQPVSSEVLLRSLATGEQWRLGRESLAGELFLENYIVRHLMDFDDICYDRDRELLFKLSGQLVDRVRGYLPEKRDVENVIVYNQKRYAELIHAQMQAHFREVGAEYEVKVSQGFEILRPLNLSKDAGAEVLDFRMTVPKDTNIRRLVFGGFKRSLYTAGAKFDSLPELRFARILEDEPKPLVWMRPAPNQFHIYYNHSEQYRPDFLVETSTEKLLVEVKRSDEVDDATVQAKAQAARLWCERASEHCRSVGSKPWRYVLIPDVEIGDGRTLEALVGQYGGN